MDPLKRVLSAKVSKPKTKAAPRKDSGVKSLGVGFSGRHGFVDALVSQKNGLVSVPVASRLGKFVFGIAIR